MNWSKNHPVVALSVRLASLSKIMVQFDAIYDPREETRLYKEFTDRIEREMKKTNEGFYSPLITDLIAKWKRRLKEANDPNDIFAEEDIEIAAAVKNKDILLFEDGQILMRNVGDDFYNYALQFYAGNTWLKVRTPLHLPHKIQIDHTCKLKFCTSRLKLVDLPPVVHKNHWFLPARFRWAIFNIFVRKSPATPKFKVLLDLLRKRKWFPPGKTFVNGPYHWDRTLLKPAYVERPSSLSLRILYKILGLQLWGINFPPKTPLLPNIPMRPVFTTFSKPVLIFSFNGQGYVRCPNSIITEILETEDQAVNPNGSGKIPPYFKYFDGAWYVPIFYQDPPFPKELTLMGCKLKRFNYETDFPILNKRLIFIRNGLYTIQDKSMVDKLRFWTDPDL
uniref:Uncharacterized protein n=2 Tax=Chromera velia TaxID=505693 RepID=D9IXI0_9ALVE|nr:hypothetical protein CHVEC_pgp067 [Chromera velia]ADJ66508.1 hypothetical protein [Chromera velia]